MNTKTDAGRVDNVHSSVHGDQELSPFGAAGYLRSMGCHDLTGEELLEYQGIPYRQGHFTRSYRAGDMRRWFLSSIERAKYFRTNGFLGELAQLGGPVIEHEE